MPNSKKGIFIELVAQMQTRLPRDPLIAHLRESQFIPCPTSKWAFSSLLRNTDHLTSYSHRLTLELDPLRILPLLTPLARGSPSKSSPLLFCSDSPSILLFLHPGIWHPPSAWEDDWQPSFTGCKYLHCLLVSMAAFSARLQEATPIFIFDTMYLCNPARYL